MPVLRFVVYGIAKSLSKIFGLATMTFFGRMPSQDDDKMAAVGLLSITWVPVLVAVFVPALGEMLIPFAPDDEGLVRAISIAAVVALPLVNGVLVARMHNRRRQGARAKTAALLHAYWYTPLIGLVVIATIVLVPFIKTSHIVRRFEVIRLLIMIPEGNYDTVLDHLLDALRRRGIEAEVVDANRTLRFMFRALGYVLGHIFGRDVANELKTIEGRDADGGWFEVTVHAADVTVLGKQKQACRIHAVLAEELDERVVYFTWDDQSQALEERMLAVRESLAADEPVDLDEVRQLGEDLATLELGKEEWNNVRRSLYRLERDAYARAADAPEPEEETRRVQERPARAQG